MLGRQTRICISRDIHQRIEAGLALDIRCRPIFLAYPAAQRDRAFAVAYLTDGDYARAEARVAARLPHRGRYADDPIVEARIRELLEGDTLVLIDRAHRTGSQHDFALIESSKRRMQIICPGCLSEALEAAGCDMRHCPSA